MKIVDAGTTSSGLGFKVKRLLNVPGCSVQAASKLILGSPMKKSDFHRSNRTPIQCMQGHRPVCKNNQASDGHALRAPLPVQGKIRRHLLGLTILCIDAFF